MGLVSFQNIQGWTFSGQFSPDFVPNLNIQNVQCEFPCTHRVTICGTSKLTK